MRTKQTNFAICDCLIVCLEARPVADSKTSLIMPHSERFKSLLKGFTALERHLIFCMLLDTINYTDSALHIFLSSKLLDSLQDTWGPGRIHLQLPPVHFRASPCPTTRVLSQHLYLPELLGVISFTPWLRAAAAGVFAHLQQCGGHETSEEGAGGSGLADATALVREGVKKCHLRGDFPSS